MLSVIYLPPQPQPHPQPPHVDEVPHVSEVQAVPESVEVIPPQPQPVPPLLPVPVPPQPHDGTMDPHLPPRCHGPVNSQFSQVILKPVLPVLQLQFAIKKSPFTCPPTVIRHHAAPFRYSVCRMTAGAGLYLQSLLQTSSVCFIL